MITPDIEFQSAIRAALVADPVVTGLVPVDSIRAGSTRPEKLPCIILANPQTIHLGRTAGGSYLTRVYIDLHIWALEDGAHGPADRRRVVRVIVGCTADKWSRDRRIHPPRFCIHARP